MICREVQSHTHQIEKVRELREIGLMRMERVGLTAGASTPPRVIEEVAKKVRCLYEG